MKIAVVEAWVEAPLRRFVDDARARLALLLHPSGQVLAQAGFTREVDVMTACALAAAAHATAGELGRRVEGRPFRGLHYAGPDKQLFMASVETARGAYICLTVFDQESSLGLVRMYFDELSRELANAAPPLPALRGPALAVDFENDLNKNLAMLFGRDTGPGTREATGPVS
jgi:predicted regulator of Ras-like GTPase activity (Roadblock/LC7/MglB family)